MDEKHVHLIPIRCHPHDQCTHLEKRNTTLPSHQSRSREVSTPYHRLTADCGGRISNLAGKGGCKVVASRVHETLAGSRTTYSAELRAVAQGKNVDGFHYNTRTVACQSCLKLCDTKCPSLRGESIMINRSIS